MIIPYLLTACCCVGFLISFYFTLVYYKVIRPNQWFIPPVCRFEEGACNYIIHTPDASVLGIPNFVLGLFYYSGIIIIEYVFPEQTHEFLYQGISAVSAGVVLLGCYLSYSLIVKLKTTCVLCFTSHGLNLIIMILLINQLLSV